MGRKLTNTLEKTPVVSIKKTVGSYMEGVLLDAGREVPMKRGKSMVYEFQLLDTDMDITLADENGKYNDIDVEAGAKVSLFAPTVLAKALAKAQVGETVRITYLGKKMSKKGGAEYHDFDAEVL